MGGFEGQEKCNSGCRSQIGTAKYYLHSTVPVHCCGDGVGKSRRQRSVWLLPGGKLESEGWPAGCWSLSRRQHLPTPRVSPSGSYALVISQAITKAI